MSRSARRTLVALLVLAVLLPGASIVAMRASATPPPTAPSAGRGVEVVAGEMVRIVGATPQRVRRSVVLQRRDGGRWRVVDRSRTDRNGRYAFAVRARSAGFRVVAPSAQAGRERLPAWASRVTPVRLVAQHGAASAPMTAASGGTVPVSATFTPARAKRPVRLETREGDRWTVVARGTQDAAGVVVLTARPADSASYRMVAAAWRGARSVATAPVTVTVPPTSGPAPSPRPGPEPGPSPSPDPDPDPVPDPGPGPDDRPWVTGYYAAWYWDWLYPPEEVDMTAMTHFVFGRMAPGAGTLGGEPGELMQGAWSAQEPGGAPDGTGRSIEDYLIDEAHEVGTKALLMLGGDGPDGRGFMLSTANDQIRAEFVENIIDYLVEHDYDGVDLDWENCLDGGQDCGEAEGEDPIPAAEAQGRLLALIEELRAEMATRARYAETPGLITFPGYTVKTNENGGMPEQWQTDVALAVDQYNLMSYGVGTTFNGGGWLSWFSGALYGEGGLNPVDISSSVDAYAASGVPRDRIGIGIGFYGIYFGPTISGPRQPTDGNEIWETYDPALSYSELDRLGYFDHGTRHWDEQAQSTYRVYVDEEHTEGYVPPREHGPEGEPLPLRNPAGFLSYEDEQSIAAKGRFVRETGVGGTILWTINYGWLPRTGTNPLLDAVKRSFLGE